MKGCSSLTHNLSSVIYKVTLNDRSAKIDLGLACESGIHDSFTPLCFAYYVRTLYIQCFGIAHNVRTNPCVGSEYV